MSETWREGARANDPFDRCPGCQAPGCYFSSDFKKLGRHSLRVCRNCGGVFVDGRREGACTFHMPQEPPETPKDVA